METYIILGVLVGLILFYLIFVWVSNVRKTQKAKKLKAEFEIAQSQAKNEIIAWVNIVIRKNQELLDNFVVSIGKYKMGDINNIAKELLNEAQKTTNYDTYFQNEDFKENVREAHEYINNLKATKSNLWKNKCAIEIDYFQKQEQHLKDNEDYEKTRIEVSRLVNEKIDRFENYEV
ncbi:MHJ_0274 family protein [Candidatus Mycoplasma pogonae]